MPIGSIITEVAVLEIHIDSPAVASMKPKIILGKFVPILSYQISVDVSCIDHGISPWWQLLKTTPQYLIIDPDS